MALSKHAATKMSAAAGARQYQIQESGVTQLWLKSHNLFLLIVNDEREPAIARPSDNGCTIWQSDKQRK
jgi:hypothetical protein